MAIGRTFTWGDLVRVDNPAPPELRPGDLADVVGFRETDDGVLYTVEFGDGSDAEVSERLLSLVEPANPRQW